MPAYVELQVTSNYSFLRGASHVEELLLQVIQWHKDDIDALRFMKVDVLVLGMLDCMRRSFELLEQHQGVRMDIASIPAEDPATYAMIRRADTLGTFQIERRAQMSITRSA